MSINAPLLWQTHCTFNLFTDEIIVKDKPWCQPENAKKTRDMTRKTIFPNWPAWCKNC